MYCSNCGSLLNQGARFCPSCGRALLGTPSPTTPIGVTPSQAHTRPKKLSTLKLILFVLGGGFVLMLITGIFSSDKPSSTQNSTTAAVQQSHIVRPTVAPPKFYVYKSKAGFPTSIVVPVKTTDEQLKSLLWLFREKVRAHKFKDIGLKNANYGLLTVYRGSKCANEQYMDRSWPCGRGEHDDADYQWGIEGDYDKDEGSVRVKNSDTVVFDYNDGWQVAPEVKAQLADEEKLAQSQREIFAQELQQRLTSMGYDINVWAHGDASERERELNLDSEMFKETATRVQFINDVLPSWKKDLCRVGFRKVRLTQGGTFELGREYSLGCNE